MPDEVEGKLIITGADAPATYEAIGRLEAIAGYRVARREVELISDAYFDGPERPLFAVRLALRVRNINGREKHDQGRRDRAGRRAVTPRAGGRLVAGGLR